MTSVTASYLDGIHEGRAWLRQYGMTDALAILANLEEAIKGFSAQSPVGQHLRGERDFWRNQLKQRRTS